MNERVVVLMGGFSQARDVSLTSGTAVAAALEEAGYAVVAMDVRRDLRTLVAGLEAAKPNVVFNALHGRFGANGAIQGLLDIMKLPYTHSGLSASALAANGSAARMLFAAAGLPVAGDAQPTGSDRRIAVAVMGDRALGAAEIIAGDDGKVRAEIPATLSPAATAQALDLAGKAYRALGCRGVCSADLAYGEAPADQPCRLAVLGVETQPPLSRLSPVPELARLAGIGYVDLVRWIVENARCDG
jgi:D-alanine-D-alanine ligase